MQFELFGEVSFGVPRQVVMRGLKCDSLFKPVTFEVNNIYLDEGYYSFNTSVTNLVGLQSRVERVLKWSKPSRILDVGCGNGAMVKAYLDEGWNAYGVDPFLREPPDPIAPTYGRLFCADLAVERLPVSDFDVVTCWYVFEHLSDPWALL
ncbi:MAG: class I SAM-dependent methyltransferase, partial [Candidatus Bilamarchaeaceae archaeon]